MPGSNGSRPSKPKLPGLLYGDRSPAPWPTWTRARQPPLLYGPRRPIKNHRLAEQRFGICLPALPGLTAREKTTIAVEIFRLSLWEPGPRRVTTGSHYALRVLIGGRWLPYPAGPELEEGDIVIEGQMQRYKIRALLEPTAGPLLVEPIGGSNTWRLVA